MSRNHRPCRPAHGFTLIELMIAVAIVVMLAAVALPSFLDSIRKSRRTEAFTAISAVQQAQERWRSNNASYAADLATLSLISPSGPAGYYTLSIVTDEATRPTEYIVSAVAVAGTSQAKDGACARLAARVAGGQITYAGCESCVSFSFSESNSCWNR